MELLLSLCIGIGLSATCGFRVFVPLLVMSVAQHTGHLELSEGFVWLGSNAAMITFSIATVIEICGYFIPWVDNLLDTVAAPAAVAAGTIATASVVHDVSPFLKWSLAVMGGGGAAAAVQGVTTAVRGASTVTTGGAGNFLASITEDIASFVSSVMIVLLPVFSVVFVAGVFFFIMFWLFKRSRKRKTVEASG